MTIKIDSYEVEIKAKGRYSNRFNKNDTMDFLNFLSMAFSNARNYHESQGYESLAELDNECSDNIYNFLDSLGFYDELRNKHN